MKRIILLLLFLLPLNTFAVFGLTQSADLELSSSQYFSRADNASLSMSGDFSVEAWINIESHTGSERQVAAKWGSGANRGWEFVVDTGGVIRLRISETANGSAQSQTGGTTDLSALIGQWIHVAGTFNSSTGIIAVYVNGSDDSGATSGEDASFIFDNNEDTLIGARNATPSVFFDGKISLVRIWSELRTESEINDNKCNVLGSTANLEAEWTLDNTVNDNSGNSNTLTNNNSVPFVSDVPGICAAAAEEEVPTSQWW